MPFSAQSGALFLACFAVFLLLQPSPGSGLENGQKELQISGAGPSTRAVMLLAESFMEEHPGYRITVPLKSIKHRGGLEWATLHHQPFGRLGRPLSPEDVAAFPTARELPIGRIKIGFAVNRQVAVGALSVEDLRKIYTGRLRNWQELGGVDKPIILLGREQGEANLSRLSQVYPFFKDVQFKKIYRKDHLMVHAIRVIPGAIGFAAEDDLAADALITLLHIDDFQVSQQIGLVYDLTREAAEVVRLMKQFVASAAWQQVLLQNGMLPVAGQ